ncbi:hypothetical protein [Microbacterium sp.]|uniref:hypothetical protein n=1 Tax=Microbacterium sp. TaxID=51671 RepID=UPI0039E25711
MARTRTLLGAALVALLLTACAPAAPAPTPAATPTPTATETVTPTPTPTSDPAVAEIRMDRTGLALLAEDGTTVLQYAWADEGEPVVAALEEAFDGPPTISTNPGDGTHYPDYTVYLWDGITFYDEQNLDRPRAEYPLPSFAVFTADQSRGIRLTTASGVSVGTPVADVLAIGPVKTLEWGNYGTAYLIDVAEGVDPASPDPVGGAVAAVADPDDTTIVEVRYIYDGGQ